MVPLVHQDRNSNNLYSQNYPSIIIPPLADPSLILPYNIYSPSQKIQSPSSIHNLEFNKNMSKFSSNTNIVSPKQLVNLDTPQIYDIQN